MRSRELVAQTIETRLELSLPNRRIHLQQSPVHACEVASIGVVVLIGGFQ
jgi:hypothetical protein